MNSLPVPPDFDHRLDVRGLSCPLPVLKAQKRLRQMPTGAVLTLLATDPMMVIDVPHLCSEHGHELLSTERSGEEIIFKIKRK